MHCSYFIQCFELTLIESMLVTTYETVHVFPTPFVKCVLRRLNLLECPDWVQNDVMYFVKLTFLDRQKFSHNCCQTVKVVAMKAFLLREKLVLVEHEIFFYKTSVNSHINIVSILGPGVKNASQENSLLFFLDHLHQEL